MSNCRTEGELRAYLDRELSAAEMTAVAGHVAECSDCDALCTDLAGRAARVFAMMDCLRDPDPVAVMRPLPRRAARRIWWPVAAVALAAGLVLGVVRIGRREEAPEPIADGKTAGATTAGVTTRAPAPTAVVAERIQPVPVKARPVRAKAAAKMDYFVALDDEPIESGVIVRMALEPGSGQADIVFDPSGRARAIRLVSAK